MVFKNWKWLLNLFRKKKLSPLDLTFLSNVVASLPSKYSYLIPQVSKEFILTKKINELGDEGTYTFILNANLEPKFSNSSLPQLFILKDIGIWNNHKNKFENVELHILEGMLAGFRLNAKYSDLDIHRIDISKIKEKHFLNDDKEFVKSLFGEVDGEVLAQLDINSTFMIDLEHGKFYVIKDFRDGNYLAVNQLGEVYSLIHDPYEVEKIFESTQSFIEALRNDEFRILKFYNERIL